MSSFLEKIYGLTKERVAKAKGAISEAQLKEKDLFGRQPHKVKPVFTQDDYNIIAEIKFASPSEGDIHPNGDPVKIAQGYLGAGACMLSVLTEPLYFKGELAYLEAVRRSYPDALLLRKDFMVDPYQLVETRAYGADAILLIVAMTDFALTKDLFAQAQALGLTPLVEVHDDAELEQALEMKAGFIGVNNRNLKTLKTDLETSRRLIKHKPKDAAFICESGLSTADDLRSVRSLGYDGFLMGTSFMRQKDPGAALRQLRGSLACA
jgi:indole-3-glycerol phosphate synthase